MIKQKSKIKINIQPIYPSVFAIRACESRKRWRKDLSFHASTIVQGIISLDTIRDRSRLIECWHCRHGSIFLLCNQNCKSFYSLHTAWNTTKTVDCPTNGHYSLQTAEETSYDVGCRYRCDTSCFIVHTLLIVFVVYYIILNQTTTKNRRFWSKFTF